MSTTNDWRTTHGLSRSPEYSVWSSMWQRCSNPKNEHYDRYGGRGIEVCARWEQFENFLSDIGLRPSPAHSIDRIDNNKNYEPGNVRWATDTEQNRNNSAAFRWCVKGLLFETHMEAAKHFQVSGHTVRRWVNGEFDKRRNTFTKQREDCYVISRY